MCRRSPHERIFELPAYFQFLVSLFVFAIGVSVCWRTRARLLLYPVSFPLFLALMSGRIHVTQGWLVVYHLFALVFIGHSPFHQNGRNETEMILIRFLFI